MDRDAIEYIKDVIAAATENHIQIVDGEHFYVNGSKADQVSFRVPETLDLFSLTQVVSCAKMYVQKNQELYINIEDHEKVNIYGVDFNRNGERDHIGAAHFHEVFKKYSDGQYLSQEEFIIQMLSRFQESPARDQLMKTISSIKSGQSIETDDDGFSQKVEVKAGVTLVKEQSLQNLWILQPFKTFPEIAQPAVKYILRVRKGTETPQLALFEADGGEWKVRTTQLVRDWLIQRLKVELADKAEKVIIL